MSIVTTTEKEYLKYLESHVNDELLLSGSDKALNFRKEFFNPKQKLSFIRWWFDKFPTIQLTKNELDVIKKIIVKPKSTEWTIVKDIINFQENLSGDEIDEWFKTIRPNDIRAVSLTYITNTKTTNIDYKMELFENLLNHINYTGSVIFLLNRKITSNNADIYDKLFYKTVDYINNNNVNSALVAEHWSRDGKFLNLYAMHRDIVSKLLYEKTGLNQYLSKAAKDIFLF